jgi:hypothetical protein
MVIPGGVGVGRVGVGVDGRFPRRRCRPLPPRLEVAGPGCGARGGGAGAAATGVGAIVAAEGLGLCRFGPERSNILIQT